MLGSIAAVIDRLNALAVQAALTYILLKADFGIWALASPILALSTILIQTAIRDILIHRSKKFHLWSNPAAWLSLTLGLIAALTVIILGHAAASLYNTPQLSTILLIAAVQPLASSITIVPRAKMSIDMRFGTLAAYYCTSSITNWTLALLYALMGAGVYAFPLGIGTTGILQIFAIRIIAPIKLKPKPQLQRWKYIIGDATTIIAANFANWIRTQGDRLILGFFLTQSMMGIYFLAFQLSIQTFSVITLNLSSVLLPTLASLNDQPERQINAFIRSLKMLLFLAAAICAATIVVAQPLTRLIFDQTKWVHLDTTLQLITAGMVFRAIEPPVRSLMSAQGRFKELFYLNISSTIAFIIFITTVLLSAGLFNIETAHLYAAAIAGVAFHILWAIVLIHTALKPTTISTPSALLDLTQPLIYATIAALLSWAITLLLPQSPTITNDTIKIATAAATFLSTYIIIAHTAKPKELNTLTEFALKVIPSRLSPIAQRAARLMFNYTSEGQPKSSP